MKRHRDRGSAINSRGVATPRIVAALHLEPLDGSGMERVKVDAGGQHLQA